MKILICALGFAWLTSMAPLPAPQSLPDAPAVTDLLNLKPQKFVIGEKDRALLAVANWRDKTALEAISKNDLEGILRGLIEDFKDRDNPNFPIIGQEKIVDLNHDGTYSIVLWLNFAATMYTGAAIIKEAQQYSLYFFYGDISLKDLVGNGRLEIVVYVPIIYKAGIFFGGDPMSSVGWHDVFVLDGTLQKADSRFPEFYRKTLAEYEKFQENIRNFDFKGYAARNKGKYANPDLYEKGIVGNQSEYLKILSMAIRATESILKEK
jgi:hypothetical protein